MAEVTDAEVARLLAHYERQAEEADRCGDSTAMVLATLKASVLRQQGAARGLPCANAHCALVATRRVFWPVAPGKDFPLYCEADAAWARTVLEAMGQRYHDEALPARPVPGAVRAISVDPL